MSSALQAPCKRVVCNPWRPGCISPSSAAETRIAAGVRETEERRGLAAPLPPQAHPTRPPITALKCAMRWRHHVMAATQQG